MSQRISRLEFDQLAPSVQKVLDARVKRLGYLGEFFKCSGHQPEVLVPFMEMTEALKHALPDRLTELGALTVATLMANDYERNQHERLSRKLGFGEEWVAAVERLDPDGAAGLSEAERAVQRLVIRAVERRGQNVAAELDTVIGHVGPQQAVAILFLVGRYITHAIIVNALGLAPPVSSIFNEAAA
jgi:alkylhydroperoxidase family enzyme